MELVRSERGAYIASACRLLRANERVSQSSRCRIKKTVRTVVVVTGLMGAVVLTVAQTLRQTATAAPFSAGSASLPSGLETACQELVEHRKTGAVIYHSSDPSLLNAYQNVYHKIADQQEQISELSTRLDESLEQISGQELQISALSERLARLEKAAAPRKRRGHRSAVRRYSGPGAVLESGDSWIH